MDKFYRILGKITWFTQVASVIVLAICTIAIYCMLGYKSIRKFLKDAFGWTKSCWIFLIGSMLHGADENDETTDNEVKEEF